MIEREMKPAREIGLNLMLLAAEIGDILPCFDRRELGGRAVLVGRAQIEHVPPARAQIPRVHIGRQHRADEIAKMLDAVDVWQRARNQVAIGHCL
jgi:hypothetical protein